MSVLRVKQRLVLHPLLLIRKVSAFRWQIIERNLWFDLGRNSIIVILGANLLLKEEDLLQAEEIIRQSKVMVCQLEIPQETVAAALKLARKHSGWHERSSAVHSNFTLDRSSFHSESSANGKKFQSRTFNFSRCHLSKSNWSECQCLVSRVLGDFLFFRQSFSVDCPWKPSIKLVKPRWNF